MPVVARDSITLTVGGRFKGRRQTEIVKAIERGLLKSGKDMIKQIRKFTPVFRGNLRDSYQINFIKRPRRGIRIISPLRYAPVMEFGRRKGARRPPPGPIRAWVREKLKVPAKEVNSVAFLIGRAISEKGIRVTRKRGLLHSPGKGAMFRRTRDKLGTANAIENMAREVKLIEGRIRR